MKLDSSEGANLLNIQYGVAFGVIFAFCFYQNNPSSPINFAILKENYFPFFGLVTYFLIDWLTANFARDNFIFSEWFIYVWCLATWYLGSVVIIINSKDSFRYVWLSSYIIIAGIFDLFGYHNKFYKSTYTGLFVCWIYLAGIKFILGGVLFLQSIIVAPGGVNTSLHFIATIFIIIISAMKYIRYELIKRVAKKQNE